MSRPYIISQNPGPLAQLVEQLTLNQRSYQISHKRQNPPGIKPPNDLYSYKSFLGGDYNVNTKAILLCRKLTKGGGHHEDQGGCN